MTNTLPVPVEPDMTGEVFVPGNDDWMADDRDLGQGHPYFTEQIPFVRFDTVTGAILSRGQMAWAHIMRERMQTGGTINASGHMDRDYVDLESRTVHPKTDCPARLDGMVLSALPVPCRIEIDNPGGAPSVYAWTEPSLTLAFDHAGTWTVRVLSVPHLPGVFTVAADG